jgi:hypothetical protein
VQGNLLAHRSGQQAGEPAAAMTADDQARRAAGGVQEHTGRIAEHRPAVDRQLGSDLTSRRQRLLHGLLGALPLGALQLGTDHRTHSRDDTGVGRQHRQRRAPTDRIQRCPPKRGTAGLRAVNPYDHRI